MGRELAGGRSSQGFQRCVRVWAPEVGERQAPKWKRQAWSDQAPGGGPGGRGAPLS